MPPLPRIEGCVKAVFTWKTPNNVNAVNIFHLTNPSGQPVSLADLQTITTGLTSTATGSFQHFYRNLVSADYPILNAHVADLGANGLFFDVPLTGGGGDAAGAAPPQCCMVISWHANSVIWRGGRFRTYLPGLFQGALASPNSSQILPGFRATAESFAEQMLTAANNLGTSLPYSLCGVSYFSGHDASGKPTLRPQPKTFPFLSLSIHGRIDSQRRRSGKESNFT